MQHRDKRSCQLQFVFLGLTRTEEKDEGLTAVDGFNPLPRHRPNGTDITHLPLSNRLGRHIPYPPGQRLAGLGFLLDLVKYHMAGLRCSELGDELGRVAALVDEEFNRHTLAVRDDA